MSWLHWHWPLVGRGSLRFGDIGRKRARLARKCNLDTAYGRDGYTLNQRPYPILTFHRYVSLIPGSPRLPQHHHSVHHVQRRSYGNHGLHDLVGPRVCCAGYVLNMNNAGSYASGWVSPSHTCVIWFRRRGMINQIGQSVLAAICYGA